eukprot:6270980-Alexandrium_andersonii.AAC.1
MLTHRYQPAAAALRGAILVCGGRDRGEAQRDLATSEGARSSEIFDFSSQQWTRLPSMTAPR